MGKPWYDTTGWCAYTSRGNTMADTLATCLYTAAQAWTPTPTAPYFCQKKLDTTQE